LRVIEGATGGDLPPGPDRMPPTERRSRALAPLVLASLALAGCGHLPGGDSREHECMTRVMYFESNRSSAEGMLAVGTVVMNRVESDKFPDTVCAVVGQKNQFAKGVLTRPMKESKSKALAEKVAWDVLRGKRHRGVGKAMFFHTAGYSFPYKNMHYMVIAGGNAFYDKRTPKAGQRNRTQGEVMLASRERSSRYEVEVAAAPARAEPASPPRSEAAPVAVAAVEVARIPVAAPPAPVLAVAPIVIAPTTIEDLIALNGG
jgi:spore germination cell wall hydrolase CwlJ-like protein